MKIFAVLALFFCLSAGCQSVREPEMYFKGVSFVGTGDKVTSDQFTHVSEINANAITLMPFAYGKLGEPRLVHDSLPWQWWGESAEGVRETARLALEANLLVMIKPHLWLDWGSYTGDHGFDSNDDWLRFEEDYRSYILEFARMSEELQLPVFCIGTELERSVIERPRFWIALIDEIRKVYSGQLTYAANWDNYTQITFWGELDFIGVDAYFPLDSSSTPKHPALLRGWKKWHDELKSVSEQFNRPVIFTEWGYRSADHAADEPWACNERDKSVNLAAQATAYSALLETVEDAPWFAGGFVWKWFPEHDRVGGAENNRYTPQNKPAEKVLQFHFEEAQR